MKFTSLNALLMMMMLAGSSTWSNTWSSAWSATLTEDFSTLDHADMASSTGVWNVLDHSARAKAYADSDQTRPIDFGDGRDGVVNTNQGYTFNTDAHPNGFHFQSLSITAGTITVVGSHPLVIRSLSGITIANPVSMNVSGARGTDGILNSNGVISPGGASLTCRAKGGDGGAATAVAASDGGDAVFNDGSLIINTHGQGQVGGLYPPFPGPIESKITAIGGPVGFDFDTDPVNDFICGTSGAGGGGYTSGVGFASGGAGGAGGGVMKLVAVGDIQVDALEARGGDGGIGLLLPNGACSGSGTGGYGGVIFFQTLGNLSTTGPAPDVSGGHSGESVCIGVNNGNGDMVQGYIRGDLNSANVAPGWATVSYSTDSVPANLQSFVQSKAYDLGVLNASFSDENVTAPSGSVTMTYAGSADGVNYSAFSSLNSLNNKGYRYIKFRANFTNPAGPAGVAPKITGLTLNYTDLGLEKLDAKLFAGCGTISMSGSMSGSMTGSSSGGFGGSGGKKSPSNTQRDVMGILFTLLGMSVFYGITRLRLQ